MSILPGLRDLRTPLAAGYVWLGCCWLIAAGAGWRLPLERPTEESFLQDAYDLAAAFGSVTLLGVVSFLAYVLGSFVEISMDSRMATLGATSWRSIYRSPVYEISNGTPGENAVAEEIREMRGRLINSLSPRALRDLNRYIDAAQTAATVDPAWDTDRDSASRVKLAHDVLEELPQLATRLLVKNQELYARYDRFLAEASFRLNIALPLSVLAWLFTMTLSSSGRREIYISGVIAVIGVMLFRQGSMRAVKARDTVVQALTIEDLDLNSRSLEENLSRGAGLYSEIRRSPPSSRRVLTGDLPRRIWFTVALAIVITVGSTVFFSEVPLDTADNLASIVSALVGGVVLLRSAMQFFSARRAQARDDAINRASKDSIR